MTKLTEVAEGNFNFGFGTKLYLARDEEGEVRAHISKSATQRWDDGQFTLSERIPEGFKPAHAVTFTAKVIHQNKIHPQATVDLVFMPDGRVFTSGKNIHQIPTPVQLVGEVTYIIGASQFDK
ncbi:hypothetical protein HMPREF2634_02350 [Streptococcus sp. HMSC034B03]|uniref:hypothetical protein n=1 Tax=Streptococcus TaxID=1301 RepID=UPI0008A97E9C|nr:MULTISPECIES: hypothetical protein [Streptococcus]OHR61328.1 hypothetical protein HMPREF2634_02350 [Streptococcus sp. HMSC034B03]PRT73618.1 hypothetical protein C6A24_06535 [Streptococcus anginosus]